jgi:nucleoside triphosphate pyrophosphatase
VDSRPSFPADFRLFLASQSPRRHSLLREIGVPYEIVSTDAEETVGGDIAAALAVRNALEKVRHAALPHGYSEGAFVLGTDTLVTLDGQVMGKPSSRAEAADMIAALSGRRHQVISGVALRRVYAEREPAIGGAPAGARMPASAEPGAAGERPGEQLRTAAATTDVTFVRLDEAQIEAYIASGEWADKAGAYGVQGLAGTFVSEMRGEYSNVVGLPLCVLARLFREAGFDLLRRQWL